MRGLAGVIQSMIEMTKGKVGWIFIYTAEAHAIDEWAIRSSRCSKNGEVNLLQTRTTHDRIQNAIKFHQDYLDIGWQMYVDPPENEIVTEDGGEFMKLYCPWPFRIYGTIGQQLEYISEPRDGEPNIEELCVWLSLQGCL